MCGRAACTRATPPPRIATGQGTAHARCSSVTVSRSAACRQQTRVSASGGACRGFIGSPALTSCASRRAARLPSGTSVLCAVGGLQPCAGGAHRQCTMVQTGEERRMFNAVLQGSCVGVRMALADGAHPNALWVLVLSPKKIILMTRLQSYGVCRQTCGH